MWCQVWWRTSQWLKEVQLQPAAKTDVNMHQDTTEKKLWSWPIVHNPTAEEDFELKSTAIAPKGLTCTSNSQFFGVPDQILMISCTLNPLFVFIQTSRSDRYCELDTNRHLPQLLEHQLYPCSIESALDDVLESSAHTSSTGQSQTTSEDMTTLSCSKARKVKNILNIKASEKTQTMESYSIKPEEDLHWRQHKKWTHNQDTTKKIAWIKFTCI